MRQYQKRFAVLALTVLLSTECMPMHQAHAAVQTQTTMDSVTQTSNNSVVFDVETGTLTLTGTVIADEVKAYANNAAVKKIVCEEGTVLPENCTMLFSNFKAESIDLSKANTSNVTNMKSMFSGGEALTSLNVSGFDTSRVTNMKGMFQRLKKLPALDVRCFDTSNVQDMSNMFDNCQELTELDVTGFDTANVTNIGAMFNACYKLAVLNVTGFDTSNVLYMDSMFSGCHVLPKLDVTGFDTSNVTNMMDIFSGCSALTVLDLSGFDTANVAYFTSAFADCTALEKILVSDKWSMEKAESSYMMFYNCIKLTGGCGTVFDASHDNGEYARIDTADTPGYFTAKDAFANPPEGDYNGDGMVTVADAVLFARFLTEDTDIIPEQQSRLLEADPDGDGCITLLDLMIVLRRFTIDEA